MLLSPCDFLSIESKKLSTMWFLYYSAESNSMHLFRHLQTFVASSSVASSQKPSPIRQKTSMFTVNNTAIPNPVSVMFSFSLSNMAKCKKRSMHCVILDDCVCCAEIKRLNAYKAIRFHFLSLFFPNSWSSLEWWPIRHNSIVILRNESHTSGPRKWSLSATEKRTKT